MRKRDLFLLLFPTMPIIIAAVVAARCSIDFRKLAQTQHDLIQYNCDDFEEKARSGELHITVDLVVDRDRFHLKNLQEMDDVLLQLSSVFQKLAWLILFGIVSQVYVVLRFKATRMKVNVEQVHEHTA
ncbi:MAG TPA: hypothetical protein VME24_13365 [Alphaproteobacteria bacterium]|nr:hypothetical protein [Alphaproteobacteria bacterium]